MGKGGMNMIKYMNQSEHDAVMQVADLMITAAKTAPKASGKDTVTGVILTGEDKDRLSEAMREIGKAEEKDFMIRDAANVDNSICVVIIGCKDTPFGMDPCGMCGYKKIRRQLRIQPERSGHRRRLCGCRCSG